eukprot:jgi/Chlat1/3413/Chrsp23S03745
MRVVVELSSVRPKAVVEEEEEEEEKEWPLTIGAGALFGAKAGVPAVSLAQAIAAAVAFTIARRLASSNVGSSAARSPVVPFGAGNYAIGGLTSMPLLPFFLGTLVGVVPTNTMLALAGQTAASMGKTGGVDLPPSQKYVMMAVGVAATAITLWSVVRALRSAEPHDSNASNPKKKLQ